MLRFDFSKRDMDERVHNEHLNNLFVKLQSDLRSLDGEPHDVNKNSLDKYETVYLKLLERQRGLLDEMNQSAEFDEELIRKYLSLIDIEELKIREKQLREAARVPEPDANAPGESAPRRSVGERHL